MKSFLNTGERKNGKMRMATITSCSTQGHSLELLRGNKVIHFFFFSLWIPGKEVNFLLVTRDKLTDERNLHNITVSMILYRAHPLMRLIRSQDQNHSSILTTMKLVLSICSDENIEVVKLKSVCWFDVRGKLNISNLSAGIDYEIVFVVKLTNGASGWELPITIRLLHPDGRVQERQVSMLEKPKGEWIELNVGKFCADGGNKEVCFDLYEHGGHWKTGPIIKGAIIRPKK